MSKVATNPDKTKKLCSTRIQMMLLRNRLTLELWTIVLSFGRKNSDKFRIPLIFKSGTQVSNMANELDKLIGKPYPEVEKGLTALVKKYKKYDYRIIEKKKAAA